MLFRSCADCGNAMLVPHISLKQGWCRSRACGYSETCKTGDNGQGDNGYRDCKPSEYPTVSRQGTAEKELRQCKQRITKIESLYAKLYEDMIRELITEKHFQMLLARYDSEQKELSAKVKELEKNTTTNKEQLSSIKHFGHDPLFCP